VFPVLLVLAGCPAELSQADTTPGRPGPEVPEDTAPEDSGGETGEETRVIRGCRASVAVDRDAVPADGRADVAVRVRATDLVGRPLPDGTELELVTSSGRVEALPPLSGGVAETLLHAATRPGRATLRVSDCLPNGGGDVEFTALEAFSAQLHIHGSLSEGSGKMREFGAKADRDGLDRLWWTDHDLLYHKNPDLSLRELTWESGTLGGELVGTDVRGPVIWDVIDQGGGLSEGSLTVARGAAANGRYGLRAAIAAGSGDDVVTRSWKVHARNLTSTRGTLGGVHVRFKVRRGLVERGAQLRVTIPLSRGKSDDDPGRLVVFFDGGGKLPDAAPELWVPMGARPGEWVEVSADISALADAAWPEEERDLSAELITVELAARDGASGSWDLDDFRFSQEITGDRLREEQRSFVHQIATDGGFTTQAWVGTEVSGFGEPHLNAFGSSSPLFDYDRAADWGPAEAVDELHADGAIVSFNHMFSVGSDELDASTRAALVDEQYQLLHDNALFGVDLLEVGYRRREGLLEDFLAVWDRLSIDGFFVTGIGTSDVHNTPSWDATGNSFVTWVAAPELEEEAMLWNLRRGAAWFGEPGVFRGGRVQVAVDVPAAGATMGQVIVGRSESTEVRFSAEPLRAEWAVRAVVDGVESARWPVSTAGAFEATHTIEPAGGRVVRFEVLGDSGEILLLTNPVYFIDAGVVPDERVPVP
jgi:hypothetical protein